MVKVTQNWGTGDLNFAENEEISVIELKLDNQLVKTKSVNVNIAISDQTRTLCECKIEVIDDICKLKDYFFWPHESIMHRLSYAPPTHTHIYPTLSSQQAYLI